MTTLPRTGGSDTTKVKRAVQKKRRFSRGENLVALTIRTRCPDKWIIVDRETGDCWRWCNERWVRP